MIDLGVHWWASHCSNGWLYLGFVKAVSLERKVYIPNTCPGRNTSCAALVLGILLDPVPSEKKWVQKKSELGLFGMGRCFVTRMFLRWGLSPSILASFLGLTRPSLGQQTGGGGWGFRK